MLLFDGTLHLNVVQMKRKTEDTETESKRSNVKPRVTTPTLFLARRALDRDSARLVLSFLPTYSWGTLSRCSHEYEQVVCWYLRTVTRIDFKLSTDAVNSEIGIP